MKTGTLFRAQVISALSLLFVARIIDAGGWPESRGPTGQGHSDEKNLPLSWDAKTGKNVLWKAMLHGGDRNNPQFSSPGSSCPIV